jgi:hypothetical protein
MLSRRAAWLAVGLSVLSLALAVAAAPELGSGVLYLLPALVLFGLLLLGCYPGQEQLERWRRAGVRHKWIARAPRTEGVSRRSQRRVPRGRTLLGSSLAVRPPPVGVLVSAFR